MKTGHLQVQMGVFDGQTLLKVKCPVPTSNWTTLDQLYTSGKYDVGKKSKRRFYFEGKRRSRIFPTNTTHVLYRTS